MNFHRTTYRSSSCNDYRTSKNRYLLAMMTFLSIFVNKASAQESVTSPQLNPLVKIGTDFNDRLLPSLSPETQWAKVPNWFAGTWHSEAYTLYYIENITTGEKQNKETELRCLSDQTFGTHKDKEGAIWHCTVAPYKVELQDKNDRLVQITWSAPIKVSDSSVEITFTSTKLLIDRASNRILDITNSVSKQVYVPAGEDRMVVESEQDRVDPRFGHVKIKQRAEFKRRAGFCEVAELQGVDLQADFNRYAATNSKKRN